MSKNLENFLSLERLKSLVGGLVGDEVVTRIYGSMEKCIASNGISYYKFKEPISKHLNYNYITGAYIFCPSTIHYGGDYVLRYSLEINDSGDSLPYLTIKGEITRMKSASEASIVLSSTYVKVGLFTSGGKSLGLVPATFNDIKNGIVSTLIENCINDKDTLKWFCYYHILNSMSKRTSISKPIGYTTGAFANNILTRIFVRTEEIEMEYDEKGTYIVNNKIRFTICGEPDKEDEHFDFIEETTEDTIKKEYVLSKNGQPDLIYISDQADLIMNGLMKILGISWDLKWMPWEC